LQLFDRWGNIVFETNDLSVGWNGQSSGFKVEQGVYSYVIKFDHGLNRVHFMKYGTVLLLR